MASYFDEHGCEPLRSGEAPDHFLHFARLLLHGGYWQDLQLEFSQLFGDYNGAPPPTSKEFLQNLPTRKITETGGQCPVCLKEWAVEEEVVKLPCKHEFHTTCIMPWLKKTNSCPLCREEFPTDNPDYEEYRNQKKQAKNRKGMLETLHDSMFS
ncbi:E3 ubiquitin-protein ligase RNF181-like [Oratosquilla oratoria]|uniref:E3 ubiquitin-protein ligase RNF181-like n=1 Tax=Oratosquilla oratoria TaxID=337810 RepID=UPI003F77314A